MFNVLFAGMNFLCDCVEDWGSWLNMGVSGLWGGEVL